MGHNEVKVFLTEGRIKSIFLYALMLITVILIFILTGYEDVPAYIWKLSIHKQIAGNLATAYTTCCMNSESHIPAVYACKATVSIQLFIVLLQCSVSYLSNLSC